jgi:MoaA/NifB/PqqE/SkfB family radical SAM enzyme
MEAASLSAIVGRPEAVAKGILEDLCFAVREAPSTGTLVVLSSVATPGNLDQVRRVLTFAEDEGIGFHLSPEIRGRTAHPDLVGSLEYQRLVEDLEERKRRGAAVLGVPQYLRGIRDFANFRCHPLLMPVLRPDGRLYYPCLESKRAEVSVLEEGSYEEALRESRRRLGEVPECRGCCHIFCHMALSLLQRHPFSAWQEGRCWNRMIRREHAGGGHRVEQASA